MTDNLVKESDIEKARRVILDRLAGHSSIESWLLSRGLTQKLPADKELTARQVQLYRHRWLDSLIEEFSAC